jgi:NAD(P)-dependent dehydrogenase (short-subunit alcohol dehydrogenase family)
MANRNILVVGGSSGIGLAVVKELVAAGDNVWVWSRTTGALEGIAGITHHTVDVLADDELPADQLPDQLSGLVYCPGSINLKPFRSFKPEDFRQEFEINVVGAVRCLQAVERKLKKSGDGAVVLFSTVAVQRGLTFHSAISAAKGALEGLTRALAAEWAPKVRINAIAPSLTDTPLAENLLATEDKRKASAERHPLKRVGEPAEVAAMATFLLGPSAAFMTGQVIGMDGGMSRV